MRRTILLALALLAATATLATADGLMLRWQDCSGDGGVPNRTFACDSNAGSNTLVASFIPGIGLQQLDGNQLILDIASAGAVLPDWWRLWSVGSCRQLALTIAAHDGVNCPDMFELQAFTTIASYVVGTFGPNSARLVSVSAVASERAVDLAGGQEYSLARWTISNSKTVGTGACSGCATRVCILFNMAYFSTVGPPDDVLIVNAAFPGSNWVSWQGASNADCIRTPTRNSTWGAVKSLYR